MTDLTPNSLQDQNSTTNALNNSNVATNTATVAGAVSSGKMLVSETNSNTIATNTTTVAGAVSSNVMQVNETNSTMLANIASVVTNTAKIPSLGQATAASCVPVVLPTTQAPVLEAKYTGGATAALNNNICQTTPQSASLDCSGYKYVSLQINASSGISSGVISFEASADGTNFVSLQALNISTGLYVTSITPSASTSYFFTIAIPFRFFRARISTAIVGGTVTCYTRQMVN